MRIQILVSLLIVLSSCASNSQQGNIEAPKILEESIVDSTPTDKVDASHLEVVEIDNEEAGADADDFELVIYEGGSFVSMSVNPNLGRELPRFIDEQYLNGMVNEDNSHTLKPEHRKLFFDAAKLKESDTLYYYDLELDSVIKFQLSELLLTAFLSPYGEPFNDIRSYYVGFEIPSPYHMHRSFVCVGRSNPFVTGNFKPILWKRIERSEFPDLDFKFDTLTINGKPFLKPYENLFFEANGFKYYLTLLDMYHNNYHVLVMDTNTNQVVFERLFKLYEEDYMDVDIEGNERIRNQHWTGQLFNNMPVAMFGFNPSMFGCPKMQFVGMKNDLHIHCDNRH